MDVKSVLFVATEAFPFIKTGGLGEVVGSLPQEFVRQGVDIGVVIPKYGDIPKQWQEKMSFLGSVDVNLGWRRQDCGIQTLYHEGVRFYFIDNDYYFKRPGLYGFADDAERFAFFCRAVLEALPKLNFTPQILHCHDWQTAIVPLLLKAHYTGRAGYVDMRTVLTIHNAEYQGIFDRAVVSDLLGLDEAEYFTSDRLEFYGAVNYLKAGIVFADALTTVSKTYAWEITTPEGGWGLDSLLLRRQADLHGIVNGIDYERYNPDKDKLIDVNYTRRTLKRKQENKAKLQEYLRLPVIQEVPLIGMVPRLIAAKGLDLIVAALADIKGMELQLVIMGTGEEKYASMLKVAAHQHPDKISVHTYFDESMAHRIFASSDMYLQPSLSEPCGTSQLVAMRYGSVPIVRETGGLKDTVTSYNEYTGEGYGFSFREANVQDMLYTINRAISFYHDKPVWQKLVKTVMKADHSWQHSVGNYLDVYDRMEQK